MGNLETKLLTYDIDDIEIKAPIFITGLARSGTTLLLEVLNSHKDVSTHQYRDYPFVHFVYFWNILRIFAPVQGKKKVERAHKDGIMVNQASPEAIDEILWQAFFDDIHDSSKNNILNLESQNKEFEEFYTAHIKKLLYLRKGTRFACKNNYNIARIDYLSKLFPDARFVIPLRPARDHIYSMVKQHRLIIKAQNEDPRAIRYMRRHGHFEFGRDFRPLNLGGDESVSRIMSLWNEEKVVEAYAQYWQSVYKYMYHLSTERPDFKDRCLFVKYDELCQTPRQELSKILDFCDCNDDRIIADWAAKIKPPDYYKIDFSEKENQLIRNITGDIENRFWD